jgi:hypothetical protein
MPEGARWHRVGTGSLPRSAHRSRSPTPRVSQTSQPSVRDKEMASAESISFLPRWWGTAVSWDIDRKAVSGAAKGVEVLD